MAKPIASKTRDAIRVPSKGSIRAPLKESIRVPLKGSIRVPLRNLGFLRIWVGVGLRARALARSSRGSVRIL